MQLILFVTRHYVTIDTEVVTADKEGRRRLRGLSTEHYSVCKPCVLVSSCTRRDPMLMRHEEPFFDVSLTVHLSITQSMYQLDASIPLLFI
jgi:hypothetical protein